MSTIQDTVRGYLRSNDSAVKGDKNVGETERLISAAAGTLLLKLGLHHRGLSGLAGIGLGAALIKRGYSGQCDLYQYLGVSATQPASPKSYFDHGIHVKSAVTVDKPADELYAFWRKFENLPRFMGHLKSVTVLDDKTSRWVANGPMNSDVQWTAEIINDVPGELIAWRSLAGAQVDNAGSVRFLAAPGGRGTEVRVNLDYIPPGRSVGKWVAKLFGEEPSQQIHQDLRKFKQLMETGVVATINGQSKGSKLD
ncbi:MAG: hypothetical protein JWM57_4102 [Phycisphaerales bacterium]|nr:hypothetical protein [Phycisphaerales bacterium]